MAVSITLIAVVAWSAVWFRHSGSAVDSSNLPYAAVIPGKSSEHQLLAIIGSPYTEFEDRGLKILTVKSSLSPYHPDRFYLDGGEVVMKEQWFDPSLYYFSESLAAERFGQPQSTYYSRIPNPEPVKVYVSASRGIAYYSYADRQAVFRIQYFAPMSESDYLSKWGQQLTKEMVPIPANPEQPAN